MRILRLLLSTKVSLALLLALAVVMAVATFIENDYGTAVARYKVYDAGWFEIILVWLAVNFLAHIPQYGLFRKEKWPVGLFHAAFCLILLGAGVTRYLSREGQMHIREGQTAGTFYSTAKYLQLRTGQQHAASALPLVAHDFSPKSEKMTLDGQTFDIEIAEFIDGAREDFTDGEDTYLALATATEGQREDFLLPAGSHIPLGAISLGLATDSLHPMRIFRQDESWMIESDRPLRTLEMGSMQMGVLEAKTPAPLLARALYEWEGGSFTLKGIYENVTLRYVQEEDPNLAGNLPSVIRILVKNEQGKLLTGTYIHSARFEPAWHPFEYGGREYAVTYGPKAIRLPFALHLNKFELERYPGSQSPASYASRVQVVDGTQSFPYRIFMNNVLDYRGFRFYQSSYDPDERGSILAVNQDRPGTYLTYLGYLLLTVGMFFTLFARGSRFRELNRQLESIKNKTAILLLFMAGWSGGAFANGITLPENGVVPKEKAAAYGRLIVQDLDGRMKPLNTLAHEIVRKLTGKSVVISTADGERVGLNPEQFLLAVQLDPEHWSEMPLIKVDPKKAAPLFAMLGKKPQPTLAFEDFFSAEGDYLPAAAVEAANRRKPAERDESQNELLKADERFNIFYALLNGDFLRLFPNRNDEQNTWFTSSQHAQGNFDEEDAVFVANITGLYLGGLQKGLKEGDWTNAAEALAYLDLYQRKAGAAVYPTESRIRAELLYNRLRLNHRLFGPFWLLGFLMLASGIAMLFYETRWNRMLWNTGLALAWAGLAVFTFHLVLRWYVSGHAPWSDGFEMLVFSAWGILLSGLLFSGKTRFTVPLGLLFSGTLLFVSFLDWLNPEITNLMPVLHSYWLKIHVAIIVTGYAPFALGAVIGLFSLLLICFKPKNPGSRWQDSLRELTIVNEMSLTVGLFLFSVGTFLGGIWANESWGRYWAWDPKETWALISIMVYAFVLHLRLVPSLRNPLVFNLASLWAFSSIVMTSFGVNYYLTGLHSYAKGDPVPVPDWVFFATALLAGISLTAIVRYRQLSREP